MTGLPTPRGDEVRTFAPLGLRFHDAATDLPVDDGLWVTAGPGNAAAPRVAAVRTVSGVYAFHRLPGLRALTHPDRDADVIERTLPPRTVLVRVEDRRARFVPVLHRVELPLAGRGVYRPTIGSPPAAEAPRFYLFTAASRGAEPGLGAVRATLHERDTGAPAAYALLEVRTARARHLSIADAEGRAAVLFPYPPLARPLSRGSLLADANVALGTQTWELEVRVFYNRDVLDDPFAEGTPELRTLLAQRRWPADIWRVLPGSTAGAAPLDVIPAALRFGESSVLRTDGSSVLLIERRPTSL